MFEKTEPNCAIITKLTNVRPHPNADKLQLATVLGDTVIVDLNAKNDEIVIYFDSNLCLSPEFLYNNNLYSNSELNKDTSKKGYFGKNGRVRAQTFRGEKSYGFVCNLKELIFTGIKIEDQINIVKKIPFEFNKCNGVEICKKYVSTKSHNQDNNKKEKKNKQNIHPKTINFPRHFDTAYFKRNIDKIPHNRLIYIECKQHGTSQRSMKGLVKRDLNWFEKILKFFKVKIQETEWQCLNGTRNILLTFKKSNYNPYYKANFRDIVFNKIKSNLKKGEQLYYEVIGYQENGGFIQKEFPYGCKIGEHKATLYRITINQEDGHTYDLGRERVYKRAEELEMEKPYLFEKYYYTGNQKELLEKVESYTNGNSPIDPNTLREGVVVWYENNYGQWDCLKNKSWAFLEKESKQKDKEDFVDIEDES